MLSVQPLDSAEGAASYYLDVANYYENDSKSIRWLGQGAKALGIEGKPVEKAQMIALLKGMMPDGTQLGRVDKDGIHHRPGFDMTVTAPKSFSILLESGADPRLGEVFDKAVEWFVGEMEKEFAQTRQVVDGKIEYIDTQNFVIAAFRQPSSRANDPNSHTHLVVQNMTQCPDQKWRSLASDMNGQKGVVEQIMKHHIYGGLKFRNKLANLTKELGYQIASDGDGLWEIQGVPDEVLTHFSKRREAIETLMDEKGWSGAKESSLAAQKTKQDKEIIDFEQWKKDIITECHERGFNPHQLVKDSFNPKSQLGVMQTIKEKVSEIYYGKEAIELNHAKDAVHVAIESVSQREAVFELRTLKKEALMHSIASHAIVDEKLIDRVIAEKVKEQSLYQAIHPFTKKPLLTTPWQLTLESEALQRIENGKGAVSPICSPKKVNDFIKAKESQMAFALSPSQKRAMTTFLTSKDRYIAIQGYAGTGKTTMLRLTRELAATQGYEIRGITSGSSAANELRTKGGLNASTFAKELGWLQKQKGDLSKTIFVVDEASMLSNPQGHKIIQLAELFNTQLKIIGDKAQLPSPSSGKLFSVSQDYGIKTAVMTDNLRQKNAELKESALHASVGEIYDAVEKLSHVEALPTYLERVAFLANKWLSLSIDERSNTLCFAPTHRNRQDITLIMREVLVREGRLTGAELNQPILKERSLTNMKIRHSIYYSKNDVIRFNHAISRHDIKTGEYLTVGDVTREHKNKNTLPLIRDNGKTITFKLSALPEYKTENMDLERPIEIYRKALLPLMNGDRIQFKRNNEKAGIRNSELGTINAITSSGIEILTDDNKAVHFQHGAKELQHLDHGYVLTTYASQGKDKKRGLGLIESFNRFASTIQNYYVETTRGIDEMIVVTEDKEHLVKAITTNDSDKYSSIEMVGSDILIAHNERLQVGKGSIALQNVIAKKLTKEQEWHKLESVVERYVYAKQNTQSREAKKLAFTIVNEPNLYRLAQERLGFKTNTYRRDAFALETSKLFHSLTPEARQHFSVVRQYVALNQQIAKRLEHGKVILALPKADKAPDVGKASPQTPYHDHLNRKHIQRLSIQRNILAGVISRQLEVFKPYLKHYSIGELNRIGLPQHEFGAESIKSQARLERLAHFAAQDHIRETVSAYVTSTGEQREMLASQIKREAKLSHPFVIEFGSALSQQPDRLWKSIHQDARMQQDRLFRNGLSGDGKLAFDKIKNYKNLQTELRQSWSDSLKQQEEGLEKPSSIEPQTMDLLTLRNELAHELMQNASTPSLASYFNLDLAKLTQQTQKHQYRENVARFMANQGNFQERLAAINDIKNDMKGHYPFIKEAGIDTKLISKYMRVIDRSERLEGLSGDEKHDYKSFLAYQKAGDQAYREWKTIHQSLPKTQKSDAIARAVTYSSQRDYLASQLEKSPYLDSILTCERGNYDKLITHANNHHTKVRELSALNTLIQTISKQYQTISTSASTKEMVSWKNNWVSLNQQLNRIEKGHLYQFALKENPVNLKLVEAIRDELHTGDTVGSSKEVRTQSLSPILKKVAQTSQYIDAKVVNEALLAFPEKTYIAIWGEPKSANPRELRYSGGLVVSLKGRSQGLWHDFTEGVGGAPLQAIMKQRNVTFHEAVRIGSEMAGITQFDGQFTGSKATHLKSDKKIQSEALERKNKIISAKSIWDSSVPAKYTLAEKYLKQHRGIDNIEQLDIRYWPNGAHWQNCNEEGKLENKINKIPALILAARNEKGELTGVQRIYLDSKTAKKNSFMDNPKLSKGIIEGSCGIIQKGMRGSRLYIAEGPETAASIAMADSKASVLVSYGISNIKNLNNVIKSIQAKEVIIAGDNDGYSSKTQNQINDVLENFKQQGIEARAIIPDAIFGLKGTDWNDVLLHKGVSEIQKQLGIGGIKNLNIVHESKLNIPENASFMGLKMKLGKQNAIAIRDVSLALFDKDKNLNQMASNYQKQNETIAVKNALTVDTNIAHKQHIEKEMEL